MKSGYISEFSEDTCFGYGNLTHKKLTPLQAIRHQCWDCQGGHEMDWLCGDGTIEKAWRPYEEVKNCKNEHCSLWPFRTGRNPKRKGVGKAENLPK